MKILLLLAFSATTAFAQTQVPITGTIILPAGSTGGLPAKSYDAATDTLTVTNIVTKQITSEKLILINGITYPDGDYLTHLASSTITYVKYVAPAGSTATIAMKFATVSIPASSKPIAAGAAYDFPYTPPSGHVISVEANKDPGTWIVEHYAGAIRLRNVTTTTPTAVSPALTVTVAYD